MGMTIAEKVLSAHSGSDSSPGDIVVATVDYCMAQDGTSKLMISELENLGFEHAKTTRGMAVVLDHSAPSPSVAVSRIHSAIREFSRRHDVSLHDVGEGVCHQVVPESGRIMPGDLVVGADSHTCTYGALNLCSTGLGSADVAAAAHTGKLWFRVPESYRICIEGPLMDHVTPKDVILTIIGAVGADGATYKSVEMGGGAVDDMAMDGRMTMANMVVEMGAKFGLFPFDAITRRWYQAAGIEVDEGVSSDEDAVYEKTIDIDASDIVPKVSHPHRVDDVHDAAEYADIEIDQAFLGTCTNGRLSDLAAAADILRGKKVAEGVRLIVAPASRTILLQAIQAGIVDDLVSSGAILVAPGCGPCVGTHAGVPSDGDVVISTANRNFLGRMGNNKDVSIFLASPETVAASAVVGRIADPRSI